VGVVEEFPKTSGVMRSGVYGDGIEQKLILITEKKVHKQSRKMKRGNLWGHKLGRLVGLGGPMDALAGRDYPRKGREKKKAVVTKNRGSLKMKNPACAASLNTIFPGEHVRSDTFGPEGLGGGGHARG